MKRLNFLSKSALLLLFALPVTISLLYLFGIVRMRGENYKVGSEVYSVSYKDLKKGQSFDEVTAWLNNKSLLQRNLIEGAREIRASSEVYYKLSKFPATKSAILVRINDVEHSPLAYYSVLLILFFDENKKLIGFYTEKQATGL